MTIRLRIAAAGAFAMLLAGCGGGSGTASQDLRPADEVEASRAADAANDAELDRKIDLGSKVTVVLADPTVIQDDGGVMLQVHVRAENPSSKDASGPGIDIVCTGSTEDGGWQADSTFAPQRPIPSGSYSEGDLNLLIPGDGRYGETVPECATPAFLQVVPFMTGGDTFRIPLDNAIVADLNSKRTQ